MSSQSISTTEREMAGTSVPNWRLVDKALSSSFSNESENEKKTNRHGQLQDLLHTHPIWSDAAYQDALNLYDSLQNCTDSYVAGPIQSALNQLDHAFRLYGLESVIGSFNGGKDAVVILHLMRAAYANYHRQEQQQQETTPFESQVTLPPRPRVIYFDHPDEFPQVYQFVQQSVQDYDLDMIAFEQGISFTTGLQMLVYGNTVLVPKNDTKNTTRRFPLAFVLGTRASDPNAGQQSTFAPSSHYMPPFMRVNPILDWSYGHVWHFLRLFHLPYCCLYDQGYTSLGTTVDTLPCPALAVVGLSNDIDDDNHNKNNSVTTRSVPKYWPAYMLRDWDQERAGRIQKPTKDAKQHKQQSNNDNNNTTATTLPSQKQRIKQQEQSSITTQDINSNNNTQVPKVVQVADVASGLSNAVSGEGSDSNEQEENKISTSSIGQSDNSTDSSVMGRLSALSNRTRIPASNNDVDIDKYDDDDDVIDDTMASMMPMVDNVSCVSYSSDSIKQKRKTVGLLIIGDEILKGLTADVNTQAAATVLREWNVLLKRVVVVADDLPQIVQELDRLSTETDVIITSGGVGPTHDDVTIKSISEFLKSDMVIHKEMAQLLIQKMNNKNKNDDDNSNKQNTNEQLPEDENMTEEQLKSMLTEAQIKMATLPKSSKLRYLSENPHDWPILQCRNIFILPGVPQFFSSKIANVAQYLACQLDQQQRAALAYKVVLSVDENSIVPILNDIVERHPRVSIGSYPFVMNNTQGEYQTILTVEHKLMDDGVGLATSSRNSSAIFDASLLSTSSNNTPPQQQQVQESDQDVQRAVDDLIRLLPKGAVLRVDNEDLRM